MSRSRTTPTRRHVDTWTLLAVIAASTTKVRVAPNVANLPLRAPFMLARSVATLDGLSSGRVELGLGAGAFWDAIVAAGGVRRSPGEAVEALSEAIDVIRAAWLPGGQTIRHEGKHYRVKGVHAGPSPVHHVEIWLGAYRPRMLRLTGRKADGWLPSQGYSKPDQLLALNRIIDEAAQAAGRSPPDVRRLYNINGHFGTGAGFLEGRPRDWAEQLAALTLEEGMSTYILAGDDADLLRVFGEEVAPAVRQLVESARSPGGAVAQEPQPRRPDGGSEVRPGPMRTAPLTVVATPDDGTRLSPERPWDEASRPTSVPAAVDAATTYTTDQQAAAQHLIDIHDGLRAELTQLRNLVGQVAAGHGDVGQVRSMINTMTIRQNDWTLGVYCQAYCRIVTGHHTLEDRSLFPHLRAAEPELAPVMDRLGEEHEVIAEVLERVDRALVRMVDEVNGLTGVQEAIDLLTDVLLSHLAYEERELIGPIARHGIS